jgi:hypothetical protein
MSSSKLFMVNAISEYGKIINFAKYIKVDFSGFLKTLQ